METKMRVLAIVAILLLVSGCAAEKTTQENSFSESKIEQTETVRQEKPEEESNSQALTETENSSTESSIAEKSQSTEATECPQLLQKPVENNSPKENLPEQKPQETESAQPPQSEPESPIVQPENSQPTEEPEQTIPQPSEPSPQESEPPEPISEQEKTQIQIEDYIAFGKDYAQSVGLGINSEAIYCWDTPITATDPDYLERDIKSRLNRYANSGEVTEVWLWAEDNGNGSYLLYIGYA